MSNRSTRILASIILGLLLGLASAILSTLLVACTAFGEEPVAPAPVVQPYEEPVLINPHGRVPIFVFATSEDLTKATGMDFPIVGIFYPTDNGGAQIAIVGPWTESSSTLLHEFIHYLEYKMPDQAQRIRDAFHDICAPGFNIDHADLEGAVVR